MSDLIVQVPFGGRRKGDRVTDPAEVKAILDGHNAHHVIAVAPLPAEKTTPTQRPTGKAEK